MYTLYRHFAADGSLLYIGISLRAMARLGQHRRHAHWFHQIAIVTMEKFPTREAVRAAEKAAIQAERPAHNTHWQVKPPKADRFCGGCGVQVFNSNRKLCAPCRKKADRVAQRQWQECHREKQREYGARFREKSRESITAG
jgi:hypothetical protein